MVNNSLISSTDNFTISKGLSALANSIGVICLRVRRYIAPIVKLQSVMCKCLYD